MTIILIVKMIMHVMIVMMMFKTNDSKERHHRNKFDHCLFSIKLNAILNYGAIY